ncbi:MAG: T9SS type A sorting domain-containing protein [Flavobacteriales bacterium]|nr:MAG: T9SS type A sorting domain-containing protein [Flavobacteriales bacterium]
MQKTLRFLPFATALAFSAQATAQCPGGQTEVTVNITTDRYGDETTWSLTGLGGSPVYASGGPYQLAAANGAYDQAPVTACVPNGPVLVFTINDAYGDGMCCAYGSGYYSVTAGAATLATNTNFTGSQDVAYFITGTQSALDLAALTINMPNVVAAGNQTITGTMRNFGTAAINSFTLNYTVDGGAAVSQPISATINPGASYNFSHPTPWNATTGSHTIVAWASNLNGGDDANPLNDLATKQVNVATQSAQRVVLIEEFTSSTCAPCASFNNTFDPLLTSVNANGTGSNIAAIKYQMNWPSPGTDPSYNPDGVTRRTYYGVSGIPDSYLNGASVQNSYVNNASNLSTEAAVPAFAAINLTATYGGNLLTVTAEVTPYADFPGTHKLHIAAVESYSYTGGTTSQTQFKHAQRKMLPNGSGITMANLQAGISQSFTQTYSFTTGGVAQGNYNLWGQLANVKVVAFVQNSSTKEVLQAAFVSQLAVGMEENALSRHLTLYPNPTEGQLNLGFDLPASTNVRFQVVNMLGEQVMSSSRSFGSGAQQHVLDLGGLSAGSYFVQVVADGMTATRKVTLSR